VIWDFVYCTSTRFAVGVSSSSSGRFERGLASFFLVGGSRKERKKDDSKDCCLLFFVYGIATRGKARMGRWMTGGGWWWVGRKIDGDGESGVRLLLQVFFASLAFFWVGISWA
jgi:hypothetical protein